MKTMYSAIILAAGDGQRSGLANKAWHDIAGKSLVDYCVRVFENDESCAEIIVVAKATDIEQQKETFKERVDRWVLGGSSRTDSAKAGTAQAHMPHVLIHDAARPALSKALLERVVEKLDTFAAVTPAVAVDDTLKRLDAAGKIIEHVSRDYLVALQTPQGFERARLLAAYEKATGEHPCDVTLFSSVDSGSVAVVKGETSNIKLTTSEDVSLLEAIIHASHREKH